MCILAIKIRFFMCPSVPTQLFIAQIFFSCRILEMNSLDDELGVKKGWKRENFGGLKLMEVSLSEVQMINFPRMFGSGTKVASGRGWGRCYSTLNFKPISFLCLSNFSSQFLFYTKVIWLGTFSYLDKFIFYSF